MKEDIVYICPQTKTQCDDECCVSAEDCHAEAINSIISNCEPEQLNKNKMKTETQLTALEWLYDQIKNGFNYNRLERNGYENQLDRLYEQAKEMEKEREKSIFSIAYRMTPIEFGKEYCESEFEKFNKTFKQQEQ